MVDKELFAPKLVSSGQRNDVFSESKFNFLGDINSTFTNFLCTYMTFFAKILHTYIRPHIRQNHSTIPHIEAKINPKKVIATDVPGVNYKTIPQ